MANINLLDLDHKNYHMRCLDLYSHRPEADSILLVIAFLVALLSVPLCLNLVLCARKRRSAPPLCPNVHYSRAFYKPGVRSSSTSDVISTHYILWELGVQQRTRPWEILALMCATFRFLRGISVVFVPFFVRIRVSILYATFVF